MDYGITDTIRYAPQEFTIIYQGKYDLTYEAMRVRGQRPLYIGDNYDLNFALTDSNGAPVAITGATIKFSVKRKLGDSSKLLDKTATIVSGSGGTFKVSIGNTDFTGNDLITGYYDIEMTLSGAKTTIIEGLIEVMPGVT